MNDAVEDKGRIHQQCEANNLQPFKGFPTETQRDDPDKESSASVNGRPRCSANTSSHREAEEIEATVKRQS